MANSNSNSSTTPIETSHCKGVRFFKWNYDLPPNLLPPGFGLFTTLLQTRIVSFSNEDAIALLNRITTRPTLNTFTFDLKLLSSPRSFLQLLTDKFQNTCPPHVAAHMAAHVEEHIAKNFVHVDETPSQISKIVIVADILHRTTFCSGKEITGAVTMGVAEFGASKILWNLRDYFKIPEELFDSNPDNLIEVPPLKRFQGVEFNRNQAMEKEDKCAICLGELTDKKKMVKKTNCSHLFHGDCLARWLWRKPSCPMCRLSLNQINNNSLCEDSDYKLLEF